MSGECCMCTRVPKALPRTWTTIELCELTTDDTRISYFQCINISKFGVLQSVVYAPIIDVCLSIGPISLLHKH